MREEIKHQLRADFSQARDDMTVDFDWRTFMPDDHAMWRHLFARQMDVLQDRAAPEFLEGVRKLGFHEENGIPNFDRISRRLTEGTGWKLVVVPGYLPSEVFLAHLAKRQFPVTTFIRRPDQIDYLQEPDIFHDMFGHVPMLIHPVFANYMEAFGKGGVKAHAHGYTDLIDTLYWFTVEFGLIQSPQGVRIYGSGIVSSKGESIYSLESPEPNRIRFDMKRIMHSKYRIDVYQRTYFVIDSFQQLMDETAPDLLPLYAEVRGLEPIPVGATVPQDRLIHKGIAAA